MAVKLVSGSQNDSLLNKVASFLGSLRGYLKSKKAAEGKAFSKKAEAKEDDSNNQLSCCSDRVHIAYRGVSDDRLYLAENRNTTEVKFFRPIGLRVFCAECRKRLL